MKNTGAVKKYQLVTASGAVLAVRRFTPIELKQAVRSDRHRGIWKSVTKAKQSFVAKLFAIA